MEKEDIEALSYDDFNKIALKRWQKLEKDFIKLKQIEDKKKNKLTSDQESVYKFIMGDTKKAQFTVKDINISFGKGNKREGLKHILLRHYCEGCDGEIRARDILNIGNIIKNGNPIATIETDSYNSNNGLTGYTQEKAGHIYKLIINEKGHISQIITTYSNKNG